MIEKKTPTTFDNKMYYIDLNALEFRSRSRIMDAFEELAEKELKYSQDDIEAVKVELHKQKEFKQLTKKINEYIGDYVVFFYGPGDGAKSYFRDTKLTKGTPKHLKAKKSNSKAKTQKAYENNWRQYIENEK